MGGLKQQKADSGDGGLPSTSKLIFFDLSIVSWWFFAMGGAGEAGVL